MSVARQLYQLQEIDLQIETDEQTLGRFASQLGESQAVIRTRNELTLEQQHLEELEKQQHSTEWEIDDLTTRVVAEEEKLYSGRITNPKELTSLQHDADGLKTKRSKLEDKALEIMEQVELTETSIADKSSELKKIEADWREQQQQLSANIDELKATLSDLRHKRQQISAQIDPQAVEFYQELRKHKGIAIARVEQGICRGCQISLPITELQRARAGDIVQCSSCGRILFLP